MYSNKLKKIATENGYEFKTSLINMDGYCKVVELVSKDRCVMVSRYSSVEKFERDEKDIVNDILHPVNFEDEFDKMFGIA